MYVRYDDILSRINELPRWSGNGVPRYKDFEPSDLENAKEAMLVHVKCQNCGKHFIMGVGSQYLYESKDRKKTFDNALRTKQKFWVGDPPNACCSPGNSMTVIEIEVLQFWRLNLYEHPYWFRVPEIEGPLPMDW
ncbi:hypothetical protein FPV16_24730 [Methylobacterium sp. W2]|uniref:hypothetical protein n=1 Tax=Methylobacterium sp. W2 TaxID=2598107 RepID=UPI001D0CC2FB|nr:hypothetical protein [Methylobacterium sp. W2]MCC0809364.1 hypothetical protein [Methylobacterium sp. W2]